MNNNKGFTLIEIGIVLFVIGVLVVLLIPNFTQGIRDAAIAKKVIVQSRQMIQDAFSIAQSCNLSNDKTIRITRVTAIASIGGSPYSTVLAGGDV